ncbi:MAG: DNA-3-methyladenine glycosylase I [Malacoplasma sp.]|nr:DNA-3-methyladenine glycosylase I [Malacoplasma sp.]
MKQINDTTRCSWAKSKSYQEYHDNEWGKVIHNDNYLFELLCLETQSVGLGFGVILAKRKAYQTCFDFKNIQKISLLQDDEIDFILKNFNVLKNKPKINAIVANANAYLKLVKQYHSLDNFLWSKSNFSSINTPIGTTSNQLSIEISCELKKYGFKFIGPTIVYSYLEAIGVIVAKHEPNCFLAKMRQFKNC